MAWTEFTRKLHERDTPRYSSDVTDVEWSIIAPLLPSPNVTARLVFQLPTSDLPPFPAARKPSSRSDKRMKPRQMTVVPGGASPLRSR